MEFPYSVPRLCFNGVRLPVATNASLLAIEKTGKIIAGLPAGYFCALVLIGKLTYLKLFC